jgi:4-hydroxybenzoate polyprenyltransferase
MSIFKSIETYLRMIKFSHSVFALPFALTAAVIAAGGLPSVWETVWIIVAMVGARSGAMGMNRIIDRKIDAENPRTKEREIASGKISVSSAFLFSLTSFAWLVIAAYMLNPLCFKLSPVAIAIVVFYSFTKRFTWGSHFVLGLALSLAPLGTWIAIRGTFDAGIIPLVLAVAFWLPGFDMLYALQDVEFDRSHGLHSIPARFGTAKTLRLAALFHGLTMIFLFIAGFVFHLGAFYWLGMFIVTGLFIYEHSLLKPDDLSKLDMAFFNMNGYISVAVFVFTFLDVVVF